MRTSSGLPRRPSIRLSGYDYTSAATYFITICSRDGACSFGRVERAEVQLSWLGRIIGEEWTRTPLVRRDFIPDCHIVMPNHFHALFGISQTAAQAHPESRFSRRPRSLGSLIAGFKARVTSRARSVSGNESLRIWQERYYERILTDGPDIETIRNYVATNPERWTQDRYFVDAESRPTP